MSAEIIQLALYIGVGIIILLLGIIASLQVKSYSFKRKIYFIKRDRECCNELLYTARDGFFCFIYPDQKIKDPRKEVVERCSRRLSVLLNLKNGTATSFAEIADSFNKENAALLKKYVNLLQQEGKPFDDILYLKGGNRSVCIYGRRVNGADNNLYCDVVWFRDCTAEMAKISDLESEKVKVKDEVLALEEMIDGLNYPLWLRDEKLHITAVNKKYLEFTGLSNKSEVLQQQAEINNNKGEAIAVTLAGSAQKSKKMQKKALNVVKNGELYNFELRENPYYIGESLDKIGTVGYLVDNTELEKAKRSFKINQNNHLEILGVLGTAFAIFDSKAKLYFYNTSFKNLWGLENEFLEKTPTYIQFIEMVRENKMLPPVPDFKNYKNEEMEVFGGLLETKEDLLHLPDGRTIRRLRTPHPNGVIFAFEDVSDRLATKRRLNELTSIQQNILDNLSDSVIIFGANQRLKFYNRAYLKLWSVDFEKVHDEPKLETLIGYQKLFFSNIDNWNTFKKSMLENLRGGRKFSIRRDDDVEISVSPLIFYDGSIMITYTVK